MATAARLAARATRPRRDAPDHARTDTDAHHRYPVNLLENYSRQYLETFLSPEALKNLDMGSAKHWYTDDDKAFQNITMMGGPEPNEPYTVLQDIVDTTVVYACDPRSSCMRKPQLPIRSEFTGNQNLETNEMCDCISSPRQSPGNVPKQPPCFEEYYNDKSRCVWCEQEEMRRRGPLLRQRTRPGHSMELRSAPCPPAPRPASWWRPPSRFGPRPPRSSEPFIPYSHRHNSRYHEHCTVEHYDLHLGQQRGQQPGQQRGQQPGQQRGQQPGQQRGQQPGQQRGQQQGQKHGQQHKQRRPEPPRGQTARQRSTLPSWRCPPRPCCRDLPVMRRSTIPSRTDLCCRY